MTRSCILLAALLISACTGPQPSDYIAPPARPAQVRWVTAPPEMVKAMCLRPDTSRVVACAVPNPAGLCTIITAVPGPEDWEFGAILAHELAHCQGWQHPKWATGE